MTRIAVVVGNPKQASRTLSVATAVADAIATAAPTSAELLVVDLAEYAGTVFDAGSEDLNRLTVDVAQSEIVIAASPTYKASYTGLLKAFFDRYGSDALEGVIGVPVMTGAAHIHALAVEVHLRPLLVELGAVVPTRGLYVTEPQLPELDSVVSAWARTALRLIAQNLP